MAKKSKTTLSNINKSNRLVIGLVGLLFGVVGTLVITRSNAAPYPGYFLPDYLNQYPASPYNPRHMGDPVTFSAVYRTSNKNPVAKITCWHVNVDPTFAYYDYGDSRLESTAKSTTSPIYTQTFSPAPASGKVITVALGNGGTGPATCDSQLYDGATLKSTILFRTL